MVLEVLSAAFFVTPVASGVLYANAAQRGLSQLECLFWAFAGGLISFSGFLLPHLFQGAFNRAYLHNVKSAPVVTHPREILALHLTVGIAISTLSVLLCGIGIRRKPIRRVGDWIRTVR